MFSDDFIKGFKQKIFQLVKEALSQFQVQEKLPYWMKKGQAATYMNVDDKTLTKFIKDGLKVSIIDGVQRISKKSADEYYESHEI